ncbi:hypothetical protein HLB44_03505 [Aquincola sp. S2]|uniref:Uncharacterized protein n=1 Tax=Pseudaquabacterium terrae TaxID=2732868 RepID=A0ABX2EAE8_9BURK|nr:hypothetical protein [Aquabacterium terrae]NRF66050.1 hypothetical protein [Aquabacterium terrae]
MARCLPAIALLLVVGVPGALGAPVHVDRVAGGPDDSAAAEVGRVIADDAPSVAASALEFGSWLGDPVLGEVLTPADWFNKPGALQASAASLVNGAGLAALQLPTLADSVRLPPLSFADVRAPGTRSDARLFKDAFGDAQRVDPAVGSSGLPALPKSLPWSLLVAAGAAFGLLVAWRRWRRHHHRHHHRHHGTHTRRVHYSRRERS